MKKILYILLVLFSFSAKAQTNEDWSTAPEVADNNMSVAFPQGTLSDFGGYELKAYAVKYIYAGPADAILGIPPIDSLIIPTSNTVLIPEDELLYITIMGSDDLCGCDQAISGDLIRFFIFTPEGYVTMDLVPEVIYSPNALLFSYFPYVSFWIGGELVLFGCTDQTAINYNTSATSDDGSCILDAIYGCKDTEYLEYNVDATIDTEPTSCTNIIVDGCTDPSSSNFNELANTDDGSCAYSCAAGSSQVDVVVITDSHSSGDYYTLISTAGDDFIVDLTNNNNTSVVTSFCIENGATISFGLSSPSGYLINGGYQIYVCEALILSNFNFDNSFASEEFVVVCPEVYDCMDADALNYNETATVSDDSCEYPFVCSGVSAQVVATTGSFSDEMAWSISNAEQVISNAGDYTNNNTAYITDVCLVNGASYSFTMTDDYGDGWNGGSFTLTSDCGVLAEGSLAEGSYEAIDFTACDSIINSVVDVMDVNITQNDTTICFGESLSLNTIGLSPDSSGSIGNLGSPNPWPYPSSFDGGYIPLGNLGVQSQFSASFWINPSDIQNGISIIIDASHGGSNNWVIQTLDAGATWTWGIMSFSLTPNTWQHVLLTYDNGFRQLFINGVLSQTTNQVINYSGSPSLTLGNWPEGGRRFNGLIDDLYITTDILQTSTFSPEEYISSPSVNTFGLWHFDEGIGLNTIEVISTNTSSLNDWYWNARELSSSATNFLWSTNDSTANITVAPTQTTTYSVTQIQNGVSSTDSVTITVNPVGCTDNTAFNYDSNNNICDNGSCYPIIYGCTSEWADNYIILTGDVNIDVNTEDESCYNIGCTNILDCNFDALATIDDESCIGQPGCLDHLYVEYSPLAGCALENACQTSWIQVYDSIQVEYYTLTNLTESYIDSITEITLNYNSLVINYNSLNAESTQDMLQSGLTIDSLNYLNGSLSEEVEYWSSPIEIDLIPGWNMIGYTSNEPQDVVATFQVIEDVILIIKNNAAEVYWPEFGFNGIGNLIPGQGYQVRVSEGYNGFTYPDVGDERIELTPTVPIWALDMEVEMHPNDIRTLVRVVNLLGQEVNPAAQFNGEVLLYLYNDGTVEKKIVE